jgi:hypothetical protein
LITVDGHSLRDLQRRQGELLQYKEQLEQRKKRQTKLVQKNKKAASEARSGGEGGGGGGGAGGGDVVEDTSADLHMLGEDEAIRLHMTQLKRDEASLAEERKQLEKEKEQHVRGIKRVLSEDQSRFNNRPVLNRRYLLQVRERYLLQVREGHREGHRKGHREGHREGHGACIVRDGA